MGIKKHLMIEYARRKNVSSPRAWEVNREAMSDLCVCFGYPAIPKQVIPLSRPQLPFKEIRGTPLLDVQPKW